MTGWLRVAGAAVFIGCWIPAASAAVFRIDNPSPAADAGFGTGISAVGDVNGDSVPDLLIGAPGAGRVDVLSGADRTVIRSLTDPEGLSGLLFGFAVADVGDVNGDGVSDIAVGAPGPIGLVPLPCNPMGGPCPPPEWGRVFLFSGATGALIRKVVPTGADFLQFGISIAALGDVNGDGVPDFAVGSPTLLNNKRGQVFAFSGTDGSQLWVTHEPPFPAGGQPIASLGIFLSAVGDMNGDGRRDVLATAPFHDTDPDPSGSLLAGKVFVLSGATGAIIRSHQAAAPVGSGFFGGKVSGLGDQNADGVEDYVIGHRGGSEILLVSGATGNLIGTIPAPSDESTGGAFAPARAGDRDADGEEDFWVGAPVSGAVYLLNGSGAVLLQVEDPGGPVAMPFQAFGISVAAVPDLNGDGKLELLIAKPGETVSGQAGAGAVFLVTSNRPPDADAGLDQVVSAGADCTADVALDGTDSSDPDGDPLTYTWTGPFGSASGATPTVTLDLGQHPVTLTVDDGNGGTDTDTVVVTVVDSTPPEIIQLSASPSGLWPPNHTLVPVTIGVMASDNCDPSSVCRIAHVASSEPDDGPGDGHTAGDIVITGDLGLLLRAERSGQGPGRVYTVTIECLDFSGNRSEKSVEVRVPHSRGN